jgi:hypothetical protein
MAPVLAVDVRRGYGADVHEQAVRIIPHGRIAMDCSASRAQPRPHEKQPTARPLESKEQEFRRPEAVFLEKQKNF